MSNAHQWPHIPPGRSIDTPAGTEFMRGGWGYWIYYNPVLNRSYYITGSNLAGWDVIEYDQPLCGMCWQRYQEYRQNARI